MKNQTNLYKNPQFIEAVAIRDKLLEALRLEQAVETQHLERLNLICVAPGQSDDVADALNLAEGRQAPAGGEALHQAIRNSRGKQSVLRAGIERQEQRMADLRGELSGEYCQSLRAEHLAIVGKVRSALEMLRDAIKEEAELREMIHAEGYSDRLPVLHRINFDSASEQATALDEISHYSAIHGGTLSATKKVTGVALRDFNHFGVTGEAGQPITVSEVIGELLRYHGMFDPNGQAVKQSRIQQFAELING